MRTQRFRVLSVNCIFIGGGCGGGWEDVTEISRRRWEDVTEISGRRREDVTEISGRKNGRGYIHLPVTSRQITVVLL